MFVSSVSWVLLVACLWVVLLISVANYSCWFGRLWLCWFRLICDGCLGWVNNVVMSLGKLVIYCVRVLLVVLLCG